MNTAQKVMDYLELKLIEKGFTKKSTRSEEDVDIKHDSLVKLKCKQGRNNSIEYYCVLDLLTKFHIKWYLDEESNLKWVK
eukprot:2570344-Ditylum_brightwellii.AAC.1